jgi:predicted metal-binding membrane protein
MTLLFVGGVMNLPWVAALAAIVLVEKVAPIGERGAMTIGAIAIGAGIFMALRA